MSVCVVSCIKFVLPLLCWIGIADGFENCMRSHPKLIINWYLLNEIDFLKEKIKKKEKDEFQILVFIKQIKLFQKKYFLNIIK